MRNIIGIAGAALILIGFVCMVITGGMLDAPSAPIGPAALMGVVTVCIFGAGAVLTKIYEGGRKNV